MMATTTKKSTSVVVLISDVQYGKTAVPSQIVEVLMVQQEKIVVATRSVVYVVALCQFGCAEQTFDNNMSGSMLSNDY